MNKIPFIEPYVYLSCVKFNIFLGVQYGPNPPLYGTVFKDVGSIEGLGQPPYVLNLNTVCSLQIVFYCQLWEMSNCYIKRFCSRPI